MLRAWHVSCIPFILKTCIREPAEAGGSHMATNSQAKKGDESEIKATNLTEQDRQFIEEHGDNSRVRPKTQSGSTLPRSKETDPARRWQHAAPKSSVPGPKSAGDARRPYPAPTMTDMPGYFVSRSHKRAIAGWKRSVGMTGFARSRSGSWSSSIRRRRPTATRATSSGWTAQSAKTGREAPPAKRQRASRHTIVARRSTPLLVQMRQ